MRDMAELPRNNPVVHEAFAEGHFTVQKSSRPFSSMAIDQAHEQHNDLIKGVGGAVGLTENETLLRRWMIAGPEVAHLIQDFEATFIEPSTDGKHHEDNNPTKSRFRAHVTSLVEIINDYGNPFEEESTELVTLVSKAILDPASAEAVRNIEKTGSAQFAKFVEERLVERSKPIWDGISRNSLVLGQPSKPRKKSSPASKASLAKNDARLFSQLYIGCQHRNGNIDDFFCHENQAFPPSLSDAGNIRLGTKSALRRSKKAP